MSRSTSNVVAAPKAFGADSQKTVASDGASYISYHRIAEHLARFYRDKRVKRLSDSKK
jgi:hypothetical protein